MAPHSSTLAWKIPWMEEPRRLQSMGSLRVGHNWATSLSLSCIGEGNGNPLQCSCLENPRDRGAWLAAIYGVTQSWTWLKDLAAAAAVHELGKDTSNKYTPSRRGAQPWSLAGKGVPASREGESGKSIIFQSCGTGSGTCKGGAQEERAGHEGGQALLNGAFPPCGETQKDRQRRWEKEKKANPFQRRRGQLGGQRAPPAHHPQAPQTSHSTPASPGIKASSHFRSRIGHTLCFV